MIDDGEVLHTPFDKCREMPREQKRRSQGLPPAPPALWNTHPAQDFGTAVIGQLPTGFLPWAYRVLCVRNSASVLHVCSGSLGSDTRGVRVDIRRAARPCVQADGRELPFRDACFDAVLIDPPYSKEYAEHLYQTDYPRPSALLREACRVVRPGRRVGMLHFLVPMPQPGLRFVEVHGVTTAPGYRIRAFTVFEREQATLWK